jgi:glycosyltransferase involved in cell wall biosynthesis
MHIVHFANHFLPSAGGVEWSVLRTAEAQAQQGAQVTVITETPRGAFDDSALPFAVRRFRVPVRRPFTRIFYWRWMWRQRAVLRDADVLHFHDYTPLVHWFLPLRAFIRGPRYAITFHGFEHWPLRVRHRILRALAARLCHVRFAVGEYVREIYGHPVDAVYLGAPVHSYPAVTPSEAMCFVYVGRLEEDTGIAEFAETLAAAAAEFRTRVQLEIAGDGRLRTRLESLRGSWMDITLHGSVEDTYPVIERARFIVATGFLAIFEAFQTGIPVLFPALTGIKRRYIASIPEADTLLNAMRSREEMRQVLLGALTGDMHPQFVVRAENARRFVSEHTWTDIADLLASGYAGEVKGEAETRSAGNVTQEKC